MRHKSRLKLMEQTALLMGVGSLLGAGLALANDELLRPGGRA